MNCCASTLTLFVDLPMGRTVPVQIDYVQTATMERMAYDLLDASLDMDTLRTLSLFEAERAIQMAREQFTNNVNRRA